MYNLLTSYIKITENLSYYNAREKDKGKTKTYEYEYIYSVCVSHVRTYICWKHIEISQPISYQANKAGQNIEEGKKEQNRRKENPQ